MVVRQNSGYWKVMCGYIKKQGMLTSKDIHMAFMKNSVYILHVENQRLPVRKMID